MLLKSLKNFLFDLIEASELKEELNWGKHFCIDIANTKSMEIDCSGLPEYDNESANRLMKIIARNSITSFGMDESIPNSNWQFLSW